MGTVTAALSSVRQLSLDWRAQTQRTTGATGGGSAGEVPWRYLSLTARNVKYIHNEKERPWKSGLAPCVQYVPLTYDFISQDEMIEHYLHPATCCRCKLFGSSTMTYFGSHCANRTSRSYRPSPKITCNYNGDLGTS